MTKIAIVPNAAGSGVFTIAAPNSNTDRTLTLPDAAGEVLTDALFASQAEAEAGTDDNKIMTPLRAKQAIDALAGGLGGSGIISTTSGTAFDVTGIPAGVQEITILFSEVSLSRNDHILVQMGTSSGFEVTGYESASHLIASGSSPVGTNSSAGLVIFMGGDSRRVSGSMAIKRMGSFTFASSHAGADTLANQSRVGGGSKVLSGELDRIRVTRGAGDTFDAGSISVRWK
jgi:hypothetical protein